MGEGGQAYLVGLCNVPQRGRGGKLPACVLCTRSPTFRFFSVSALCSEHTSTKKESAAYFVPQNVDKLPS